MDDFNKCKTRGLQGWCKECSKKRMKQWYKKTRNMRRKYAVNYVNNNKLYCKGRHIIYKKILRLYALQHYSKNKNPYCECCGETNLEFLCIDHINGGGNKQRKQNKNHRGDYIYAWLRHEKYPEGFRVLCHNCNHAYGSYGYCPHKGGTKYLEILKRFKPKKKCSWLEDLRLSDQLPIVEEEIQKPMVKR